MLEIIRPCFVALRWLQTEQFTNEPDLPARIDELERAAEKLAHMSDGQDRSPAREIAERCPVCSEPLSTFGVYKPRPDKTVPRERWCSPCLEQVWLALDSVEREGGFGTAFI